MNRVKKGCLKSSARILYRGVPLLLILALGLSGCGKNNNLADDMGRVNNEEDISSDSDGNQTETQAAAGEIPERIGYTIKDKDGKDIVNVDAEVVSEGYGNLKVYQESRLEVDDAYLKQLADAFFDDAKYEVVKPYWMCTREELSREQAYLDSLYLFYKENGEIFPGWLVDCVDLVEYYSTYYNGGTVGDLSEGQLIYRTVLTRDDDTVEYESCMLRGMVGEDEYQILYASLIPEDGERSVQLEIQRLYAEHQCYVQQPVEDSKITYVYGENVCDREQSERIANDTAIELGFSDMEIAAVYHRRVDDGEESNRLDGYWIYMVRSVNGVQNIFSSSSTAGLEEGAGEWAGQEYLAFEVDAKGVLSVYIGDTYELGACMSENALGLTFEQIDEVAKSYMERVFGVLSVDEMVFGNHEDTISVENVRFGYVTLNYDGNYTLVPVWMYYLAADYNPPSTVAFFAVNAMDGNIIIFDGGYERMFGGGNVIGWDRDSVK